MSDYDRVHAHKDLLHDESKYLLPLNDGGGFSRRMKPTDEVLQILSKHEVGLLVNDSSLQRLELTAQARLVFLQGRHSLTEFVQLQQTFLVCVCESGL